jgi:glycosyltransferase involved in cell wall biosynthesis
VSFPCFLSVVVVARNLARSLPRSLHEIVTAAAQLASDFEVIVVDNASTDDSVATLSGLIGEEGLPNLQVFALTREVEHDTACWAGLENALGDFVAVVDPMSDDLQFLPRMLEQAVNGANVVFAANQYRPRLSLGYRLCDAAFNALYKAFNGIRLDTEAPRYRVLSRRVVNFILQHPRPHIAYRYLPATAGFSRVNLTYRAVPKDVRRKRLGHGIQRGIQLLVSTTRTPMRLVAGLSLFGAVSNLVYSMYVIAVALLKDDVAPGWVTLSLQQSGMFFLISLVLLVLGEYIGHMASVSNEGPPYHVGEEFTSAVMSRKHKLNVEERSARLAAAGSRP